MSNIDQFESVFRSALHDVYCYESIQYSRILIISDLELSLHNAFEEKIKIFSNCIDQDSSIQWLSLLNQDYNNSQDLIDKVAKLDVDLIFTYRNLQSNAWQYSHSLGEYLDALIQKTNIPVVVLPHPLDDNINNETFRNTNVVMAITDHLSSENDLVNSAVNFTEKNGVLYLMHIEDCDIFDYYINAISKISTIDTIEAKDKIAFQLLKAPNDYIRSIKSQIQFNNLPLEIKNKIGFGHHLIEYRKYINEYNVDLLVMNTKDKDQMALHGLAYPLVVELRTIPLLLI